VAAAVAASMAAAAVDMAVVVVAAAVVVAVAADMVAIMVAAAVDAQVADIRVAIMVAVDIRAVDIRAVIIRAVGIQAVDIQAVDIQAVDIRAAIIQVVDIQVADIRVAIIQAAVDMDRIMAVTDQIMVDHIQITDSIQDMVALALPSMDIGDGRMRNVGISDSTLGFSLKIPTSMFGMPTSIPKHTTLRSKWIAAMVPEHPSNYRKTFMRCVATCTLKMICLAKLIVLKSRELAQTCSSAHGIRCVAHGTTSK